MGYPTHSGYGRIERNKLVSKKISILSAENNALPKKKTHKQLVAIALKTYPKRKRLPLA